MLYFYQHLPEYINPIALSIGNFNIRWYSLMYLIGFGVVYGLLMYRTKREKCGIIISKSKCQISNQAQSSKSKNLIFGHLKLIGNWKLEIGNLSDDLEKKWQKEAIINFMFYSVVGLLIGARLGYVFFYNFNYFFHNPLAIISPFSNGKFTGIFGMSYHGGLVGVMAASLIFTRKNKINLWKWADFVIPAVPAGFFFGRLGNFLNGELYGRPTEFFWGMYFSVETQNFASLQLRHPSQLYEAFFEGVVLFLILWLLRNKSKFPGYLLAVYLFGYGFFRFLIEFVREADAGLVLGLTRGQVLSLGMMMVAVIVFLNQKSKELMKIQN